MILIGLIEWLKDLDDFILQMVSELRGCKKKKKAANAQPFAF